MPGLGSTVSFFARRFAHEQLVHRIDAALALGATEPTIPDDLARRALDVLEVRGDRELAEFWVQRVGFA